MFGISPGELAVVLAIGLAACAGPIATLLLAATTIRLATAECPHCRSSIPRRVRVCRRCGRPLPEGWSRRGAT